MTSLAGNTWLFHFLSFPLIQKQKFFVKLIETKRLSTMPLQQKCYQTWKRNLLRCKYSAKISNMRTICEKIKTRWPVSFRRTSSLSSKKSFPLPRIRSWEKRKNIGYCFPLEFIHYHPQYCDIPAEDQMQTVDFPMDVSNLHDYNTFLTPLQYLRSCWHCPSIPCLRLWSFLSKSTLKDTRYKV